MSSPFAARRKARVIAQDDREAKGEGKSDLDTLLRSHSDGVLLNRGLTTKIEGNPSANDGNSFVRASSKSRKKASSRISFGLGGTSMTEDEEQDSPSVFRAKKSILSRQAIEKNALRKSLGTQFKSDSTPLGPEEGRPSYSADYLNQLKSSTPSTSQAVKSAPGADTEESKAIDLASKFGSDLSVYSTPAIPSEAEIKGKKARRARLAKEEEFINLNASDDSDGENSNEISLRPREKHPETRLVRDDEDIAEGFEEYVDDGRIALGRKAEREHKQKQKSEMKAMIEEAEGGGSSSNETDDTEVERRQAYEAAQTRAGMDGLQYEDGAYNRPQRPRTPPKITPLPTLNGCLEKMRGELMRMENERRLRERRLEEVRKEREALVETERNIQRLLREAGENYAKLQAQGGGEVKALTMMNGHGMMIENGMENVKQAPPVGNVETQDP